MAVSQRPLSLGELLDRTVELYRRNFLPMAGITAAPSGVSVLILGGGTVLLGSRLASFKPDATGNFHEFQVMALVGVLMLLVGLPLMLAAYTLNLGASTYAALQAQEGIKATIRGSYAYAFRNFWRHLGMFSLQVLFAGVIPYSVLAGIFVVGAGLSAVLIKGGSGVNPFAALFGIFVIVLFIGAIVVSILIWVRYSLAFAASLAEEKGAWPSMKRSSQLSRGTRGRIFVMFLLVWVISSTISAALMIPLFIAAALLNQKAFIGNQLPPQFIIVIQAANLAVSFLVRAFVTPIYSIALMLFYFDQRTRTEGYDIERLMDQAGWSALPPAIPSALPPVIPFHAQTEPSSVISAELLSTPAPDSFVSGSGEVSSLASPEPSIPHESPAAPPASLAEESNA